jgi:hypothetical protein
MRGISVHQYEWQRAPHLVVRIDDGVGCGEARVTAPQEVGVTAKTVDVIVPIRLVFHHS